MPGVMSGKPLDAWLGVVELNDGILIELEVPVNEELLKAVVTGAISDELLVNITGVDDVRIRLVLYGVTTPVVVIVSMLVEVVELPAP